MARNLTLSFILDGLPNNFNTRPGKNPGSDLALLAEKLLDTISCVERKPVRPPAPLGSLGSHRLEVWQVWCPLCSYNVALTSTSRGSQLRESRDSGWFRRDQQEQKGSRQQEKERCLQKYSVSSSAFFRTVSEMKNECECLCDSFFVSIADGWTFACYMAWLQTPSFRAKNPRYLNQTNFLLSLFLFLNRLY